MQGYNEKDLAKWEEKILRVVDDFGLDYFPQIFEICDHDQMLGYMTYSGMPSRYPHWSFGKHFEKQKTLHKLGLSGLPYEMVINANPSLAYLMTDNTLLLQILTMAHVYAHNDFFKNNLTFRDTYPHYTLESFKSHADRIRKYEENPHIGLHGVEQILDSCHALSFNVNRFGKLDLPEVAGDSESPERGGSGLQEDPVNRHEWKPAFGAQPEKPEKQKPGKVKRRIPHQPAGNVLLFIRDHNPYLSEWQRDLITITHDETMYFVPQIETKIMNEGWASIWHYRIMEKLNLPDEMRMEFYVRHNQVIQPHRGGLNPYYVGYKVYLDIERRWNNPTDEEKEMFNRPGGEGREKIFQVRQSDRDESFLRQYLTKDLMREMHMFKHEKQGSDRVVTKISSNEDWKDVRNALLVNIGMNSYPVIKVHDADFEGDRKLLLKHEYEGRELDQEYASKTLRHLHTLWDGPVLLETVRGDKEVRLIFDGQTEKLQSL